MKESEDIKPPIILAFNGRSASCTLHVIFINSGIVASPEFMVTDFQFLENWEKENTSNLVKSVCLSSQKATQSRKGDYGLWSHDKSEWNHDVTPAFFDHEGCSCQKESKTALFHAHTLLVDRNLFKNFSRVSIRSSTRPQIVVASRDYASAVRNYVRRGEGKNWRSNFLYAVYAAHSQSISYQNMLALAQKFDVVEVSLEQLHLDYSSELARALKSVGIDSTAAIASVERLKLQGIPWSGGVGHPLFHPSKVSGADYQTKERWLEFLISIFDPTTAESTMWKHKICRLTFILWADLVAMKTLLIMLIQPTYDKDFDSWVRDHHKPYFFRAYRGRFMGKILNLFWRIPISPYLILRTAGERSFRKTRKLLLRSSRQN